MRAAYHPAMIHLASNAPAAPPTGGQEALQRTLAEITALLDKQAVVAALAHRQTGERHDLVEQLTRRQEEAHLKQRINRLHPADIAFLLESVPLDKRLRVWDLVDPAHDGAVLLEASDAVRATLLAGMDRGEILQAAGDLETDELADLAPDLPRDVVHELLARMDKRRREQVQSALSFPEGSVGALMDFEFLSVRGDKSLDVVLRYLRRRGQLPAHTTHLMVVNRAGRLEGILPLEDLLTHDGEQEVAAVMNTQPVAFHSNDQAAAAVDAFERYALSSAPVVNAHGLLLGVLRQDAVLAFQREEAQKDLLTQAGLSEDEDLFAPVKASARRRWAWLALNLFTALLATRVIDAFGGAIEKTVALAALMPIVASIGGNTGNQTVALVIRALALNQLGAANVRPLIAKELGIALLNGALWGGVMALITLLLYQKLSLALVMFAALLLNLVLASLAGIFIPLGLKRLGRDPVMGSSVLLTALTDALGFFLFLGLAAVLL